MKARPRADLPELFLGETNIAIVQPTGVEECVHWHTPMFWKGVPEFNSRLSA